MIMWDTAQEIAIYIHKFYNLDLFQQGFYQIKVSMRWEDNQYTSVGTPARVVQYEAYDCGSKDSYGAWKINDTDNSFITQPFPIKYAKQDVWLSVMVSFVLSLSKNKVPPTSAVILKFELMQAPMTDNRLELLSFLEESSSVAIHEFRIPPKALIGLHSYCPIHFDVFHSVLVEATVHVSLLKEGYYARMSRNPYKLEDVAAEIIDRSNQVLSPGAFAGVNQIMVVKLLLVSRNALLEELQKLSKSIGQEIDLNDFMSKMDDVKVFDSILRADLSKECGEIGGISKRQNSFEKANDNPDLRGDKLTYFLPKESMVDIFHLLGAQISYLWSTFLQFHRANRSKILEVLRDAWAKDRRAEWSIWMVYSKVEMPHHYISSGTHDSSHDRKVSNFWKLVEDPVQIAATRAELHRRSVGQMKINTQSIQDMNIFGDPLRVPIIFVERVINAPRRTIGESSYFKNLDTIDSSGLVNRSDSEALKKFHHGTSRRRRRELKIVVFVHGFQGHHLDLRLVRNQWLLLDPKIEVLMSQANEDKTSGDFREMGLRLAREVIFFIKRRVEKISNSCLGEIKLSFVGHSIGNVIIRAALAESIMEPWRKHLYTYISVSGPQLGYLYSSNSLFNSGMWFMKKFKGNQCIHQLTLTDDPNFKNTFFYKLCEKKTLENFRHVILISSPQDGYVPYHSSRLELCRSASIDHSKKGRAFLEMLNNCLDQLRAPTSEQRVFMRCDVNFDTSSYAKNLNTYIGRAAHIEFLESDIFIRLIMWSFQELFH